MPPPSRFRGKLNPAFRAAHGIADNEPVAAAPAPASAAGSGRRRSGLQQPRTSSSSSRSSATGTGTGIAAGGGGSRAGRRSTSSSATATATKSREQKVKIALRTARRTGRLQLCDCNLTSFPASMFDLRSGIEIDLSLDSTSNPSSGCSFGEDELTSLDLSDNDFHSSSDNNNKNNSNNNKKEACVVLDERVERFRSLTVFRARRSMLTLTEVSWQSLGMLDCLTVLDLSGNGNGLGGCAMVECLPATLRELNLSGNELTSLTKDVTTNLLESDGNVIGGNCGTFTVTMPRLVSLDISNNQLKSLPSALEAPVLQTLNFSNNQIAILPANLLATCSRSLSTLEGKNNQLGLDRGGGKGSPSPDLDLRSCTSLRIVDLGRNAFTIAPSVAPSLVSLSLEGNRITKLTNLFGGDQINNESFRSSLTELRISSNKLATLDEDVARCLTSIIMIDASMNDLSDLPHCVGYLPVLRRIVMDGNPCLRRIRNQLLNDTKALKAFLRWRGSPPSGGGYLDDPRLDEGDGDVGSDKTASGCSDAGGTVDGDGAAGTGGSAGGGRGLGSGVVKKVSRQTNSKWRNIVNDALIGTCKLDLRNQRLNSLPVELCHELSKSDTSAAGSSVRQYSHDNSVADGDTSAINTVGNRVRRLDLSNNSFASLDDKWFEALPDMVSLNAGKNRIDTLPESMANVPLAEIIMSRNLLTSEAISQSVLCRSAMVAETTATLLFRSLTTLDLSGNRLDWFPSEICNLPNLARLILAGNGMKTLAADELLSSLSRERGGQQRGWISQQGCCTLPSLELLDLSSNKINDLGTLPDSLAEQADGAKGLLRVLLLNNNELRTVPPRLGDVRTLTTLDIRGNPPNGIRQTVLNQGCESILAYLRGRKAPAAHRTAVAASASSNSVTAKGARGLASPGTNSSVRMGYSTRILAPGRTVYNDMASTDVPVIPVSSSSNNINSGGEGTGTSNDNEEQMLVDRVAELTQTVDDCRMKLNNVHLSEAMKYKMKKDMAKHRSVLIREERKLRVLRS